MRLTKGLGEEKLLSRINRYNRKCGLEERALGFYLLDFDQRGLFKKYGFSSTAHFALMKLQIPTRKTRELIRIARALDGLLLMDEAFAEGRLSWSAVRELTRVASAETEREWIDMALNCSLRQIELAVSRASHGESPPRDPYGLSRNKLKVIADLPLEDYAVWKVAFDRLRTSSGSELDSSTALTLMAKAFLERPLNGKEEESRKPFQVVYHCCSECERAWVMTNDGPAGVPADKVEVRKRDAEVVELDSGPAEVNVTKNSAGAEKDRFSQARSNPRDPRGSRDPSISTPDTPTVPMEERDKPNTPRIRQHVLGRDGAACAVPGCNNSSGLYSHHVKWKSHGGRTEVENEVCVCGRCHSLLHDGLLQVKGDAPYGLKWTASDGADLSESSNCLSGVAAFPEKPSYKIDTTHSDPRGSNGTGIVPGAPYEDTTIYSLEEVPDQVDSAWWRKYSHNFDLKGRRLVLKKRL